MLFNNRLVYCFFVFLSLLMGVFSSTAQANSISGTVSNNSGQTGMLFVELFDNPQLNTFLEVQSFGIVTSGSYQLPGMGNLVDGVYYLRASVDVALDGPAISAGEPFVVSSAINIIGGVPVSGVNLTIANTPPAGIITTIAGGGIGDPMSDGIPAWDALVDTKEIVLDKYGNIYYSDRTIGYDRIRKIDAAGIVTTIAGNANAAPFFGDNGPALNASLFNPRGLAFDAVGNLYIAEAFNNAIRKIDTSGIITTVAGDSYASMIPFMGDGGPATNASILGPRDLVFDASGNLYVAERDNGAIRKIDSNGIITTVAGDGSGFSAPIINGMPASSPINARHLAVDRQGKIYFSNDFDQIITIDNMIEYVVPFSPFPVGGQLRVVAGNGSPGFSGDGYLAVNAAFNPVRDIKVDYQGNLYVADAGNYRVRKIDAYTGIITTVVGSGVMNVNPMLNGDGGPGIMAQLGFSNAIAVDKQGGLYVSDSDHLRIRKMESTEALQPKLGTITGQIINLTGVSGLYHISLYNDIFFPALVEEGYASGLNGRYQFGPIVSDSDKYIVQAFIDTNENGIWDGGIEPFTESRYTRVVNGEQLNATDLVFSNFPNQMTITGTVTDSIGMPVAGALVQANSTLVITDAFTDAAGRFVFENLPVSSHTLRVDYIDPMTGLLSPFPNGDIGGYFDGNGGVLIPPSSPGNYYSQFGGTVTANAQLYNPTFGTSISGSVTYANGLAASDAYITAYDVNAIWDPMTSMMLPAPVSVHADANGNYQFDGILPGTYGIDVMYFNSATGYPDLFFPNGDEGGPIGASGQVAYPPAVPVQFTVAQGQALILNIFTLVGQPVL